jgi:hypothetical protein
MRVVRSAETVPPYVPDSAAESIGGGERVASQSATPGFDRLLRGLGEELDRGERLAEGAIHGGGAGATMSPGQLIALQAGIYRYSEAVDLVSKLVDRAGQAVRTTLQSQ